MNTEQIETPEGNAQPSHPGQPSVETQLAVILELLRKIETAQGIPKLAFSRTEAAKLLGVSAASVDRLRARGLLRSSRALRRPVYSLEELRRFLQESSEAIKPNSKCR